MIERKKYLLQFGRFANEYSFASFDTEKERKECYDKLINDTQNGYVENVQYSKLPAELKEVCDRQHAIAE